MTHDELVLRAKKWLYNSLHCGYVITEKHSSAREIPDALGLKEFYTILIECKMSIQDFKKDKKKWFRNYPHSGIGDFRYYLVPDNMIEIKDLPDGWGLLYTNGKRVKVIKQVFFEYKGKRGEICNPKNMMEEYMLMYSTLRQIRELNSEKETNENRKHKIISR